MGDSTRHREIHSIPNKDIFVQQIFFPANNSFSIILLTVYFFCPVVDTEDSADSEHADAISPEYPKYD